MQAEEMEAVRIAEAKVVEDKRIAEATVVEDKESQSAYNVSRLLWTSKTQRLHIVHSLYNTRELI